MATSTATPVLGGQRHMTRCGLSLAAGIAFQDKTVVPMRALKYGHIWLACAARRATVWKMEFSGRRSRSLLHEGSERACAAARSLVSNLVVRRRTLISLSFSHLK